MASNYSVNWRGRQVRDRVLRASQFAIDEVMADAVADAKANVPVVTAALQGSIRIEPAHIERGEATGLWGSFDINYALAVETGDRGLVGPVPLGGEREAAPNLRRRGVRRGNTNFLRNAADIHYPQLARRIRENLDAL